MRYYSASIEVLKRKAKELSRLTDNLPLHQCHQVIAEALGFKDWHELEQVCEQRNPPSVLDDDVATEESEARMMWQIETFSRSIPVRWADAEHLWAALSLTASQHLKKHRLDRNLSPWGLIQEEEDAYPEVRRVSTASHGGYQLSEKRQKQIPAFLRTANGWYEEDSEWCRFLCVLPDIPPSIRVKAKELLKQYYPDLYEFLTGVPTPTTWRPSLADMRRYGQAKPTSLFPIAVWSIDILWNHSWGRSNTPKPYYEVVSMISGSDLVKAIDNTGDLRNTTIVWKAAPSVHVDMTDWLKVSDDLTSAVSIEPILKSPCKFEAFSDDALVSIISAGADKLIVDRQKLHEIAALVATKQQLTDPLSKVQ